MQSKSGRSSPGVLWFGISPDSKKEKHLFSEVLRSRALRSFGSVGIQGLLFYGVMRARLALGCCLLVLGGCLSAGCLFEGGSDTETSRDDTGTLEGSILDRGGSPAPGVAVRLMRSDFNPLEQQTSAVTVVTDDSGKYVFENLDTTASYNILGKRAADTTFAFRANLRPGGPPVTATLDLPMRLEVTLTYVDYQYDERDSSMAYFPGTDILFPCDTFTTIDTLPVGAVNLVIENEKNESGNMSLPNNNGDWGGLPMGRGGDTLRVEATKYLGQPYMLTLMP